MADEGPVMGVVVVGYVLLAAFTTSIMAHVLAKDLWEDKPGGDTWVMAAIAGVGWPIVMIGGLLILLAKMFSRQAQWIVAGHQERMVLAERRLRERRERIAAMERELGIGDG